MLVIGSRRELLGALGATALGAFVGCGSRPRTPLAHLYGQGWVRGAVELYGEEYAALEARSTEDVSRAYGVLAQKGVTALDGLQQREVPYFIAVDPTTGVFELARDVPERLTFRAGMSDAERAAATAAWEKAREHIHTDYQEIKRLNWAMARMLGQLMLVRSAIQKTEEEQYQLTRQLREVREGSLPFELPYQVTSEDYTLVVAVLLARLEDDKARLAALETSVVAVGLTVRATDARSASLAANIEKVLLAVVRDADATARPPAAFPVDPAPVRERGLALAASIEKSEGYRAWEARERDRALDQIGSLLSILDQVTGVPASAIFRQSMTVLSGDADYLDYLKLVASVAPQGSELSGVLTTAVDLTEGARAASERGLVNTATTYARDRVDRQLVYLSDEIEAKEVRQVLSESRLAREALPALPP